MARLVAVRRITTEAKIQELLQKDLSNYFDAQKFNFAKQDHIAYLKAQMELVYLRKTPLVAVDVEAYERAPKKVTEIGIAVYDPFGQALSAAPNIQTLHIIIKEHRKLLNKSFVPNNKFEFNGGVSYEMDLPSSRKLLTEMFEYYFVQRQSVLVGHHVGGDVKWLKQYGLKKAEEIPTVDTQKLYQISRRRGATLRGILRHMGIMHANLHNAANDAYYTLLAAMSYCDPARRKALGLDTYDNCDYSEKRTKAADLRQAKQAKFSDRSRVETVPPNVQKWYSAAPSIETSTEQT